MNWFCLNLDPDDVKTFPLGSMSTTRFSHVSFSIQSSFRIIYQSYALPFNRSTRSFRLHLHKISKEYFHFNDFHYIAYENNETVLRFSHLSPLFEYFILEISMVNSRNER